MHKQAKTSLIIARTERPGSIQRKYLSNGGLVQNPTILRQNIAPVIQRSAIAAQSTKRPIAPPVYKPQPRPVVFPIKMQAGTKRVATQAPPAYSPQSMPRALQTKKATTNNPIRQSVKPPAAPSVYDPKQTKPLQPKSAIKISDLHLGKRFALAKTESSSLPRGNTANPRNYRWPVIQGLIYYDNSDSKYAKNDVRSGWQKHAEDWMLQEYNSRLFKNLTKINYDTIKMARAHIGAFDNIQVQIVEYLNGDQSEQSFEQFVNLFRALLNNSSTEFKKITTALTALKKSLTVSSTSNVETNANKLLSLLNNLSVNLRAADKYLNSYIQERLDLQFTIKSTGEYSLNQHGKNVLDMGSDIWGDVPRTPEHGDRVVTSEGPVPIRSMSPDTERRIKKARYVQVPIKSKNVKERLYGPKTLSNFKKMPLSTATVPPTVSAPPTLTSSVPPQLFVTPPPRYLLKSKFGVKYDGSAIFSAYDNAKNCMTYVRIMGPKVLGDLGPSTPLRYDVIRRVGIRLDGSEVFYDHDIVENKQVYVRVQGNKIIEFFGSVEPYRYEEVKKIGTRLDGTEIYQVHDTYRNSLAYVRIQRGNQIAEDFGSNEPARYENVKKIGTRLDGTEIYQVHDTYRNSLVYVRIQHGNQIAEDFGSSAPDRYQTVRKIGTRRDGTEVYYVHDTHSNSKIYVRVQNGSQIVEDFGSKEPVRYEVIQTLHRYIDGSEVLEAHDTRLNKSVKLVGKNSIVIKVLG